MVNVDILILFFNCILTTVISSVVVIRILKKEYKPVLDELKSKEMEKENESQKKDSYNVQ